MERHAFEYLCLAYNSRRSNKREGEKVNEEEERRAKSCVPTFWRGNFRNRDVSTGLKKETERNFQSKKLHLSLAKKSITKRFVLLRNRSARSG